MSFSIIVPWYQGTVKDEEFEACLDSLLIQDYKDFEVLIYHDGELERPLTKKMEDSILKLKAKVTAEGKRQDMWGHNNRDLGIREAKGDYIVHVNSDNILYNILYNISEAIKMNDNNVYVFPIRMNYMKMTPNPSNLNQMLIYKTSNKEDGVVLRGNPVLGAIDAMQLVMSKEKWLKHNGWFDKTRDSDGIMYPVFCKDGYYTDKKIIIGEHN